MPRLTSMPDESSRAIRLAIATCGSIVASGVHDEIVDDRRGRHDMVRRNQSNRYDVVGTGNDDIGSHSDYGIEVPRGQRIAEITQIVGEKRLHQGEIGAQRRLEDLILSMPLDPALAFLDDRADPRRRENSAEPESAGANALDKRALRHKFDVQLSRHHLTLGFGIEADMARHDLAPELCGGEASQSPSRRG